MKIPTVHVKAVVIDLISKIFRKNTRTNNKRYLNLHELDYLISELTPEKVRTQRSYELEGMKVKLKDLQYYTKEDVEELRRLNKNNLFYKFYFSWLYDHFPKFVVVFFTICLWVYWYGIEMTLMALLPMILVMGIIMTFLQLVKGK